MTNLLNATGQKIVDDIQNEFDRKRLNDTGEGRASISYKVQGNRIIIEGLARVLFLEYGRRPGKMPPVDVIQKWVERKLNVAPEKSKGVAFAIAKKIAEKGTDILTDRAKGLQVELLLEDINTRFLSEITSEMTASVVGGLIDSWEKENPSDGGALLLT